MSFYICTKHAPHGNQVCVVGASVFPWFKWSIPYHTIPYTKSYSRQVIITTTTFETKAQMFEIVVLKKKQSPFLVCVAAVSLPLGEEIDLVREGRARLGWAKNWGQVGRGWAKKGEGLERKEILPSSHPPSPPTPHFSRAFFGKGKETAATKASLFSSLEKKRALPGLPEY